MSHLHALCVYSKARTCVVSAAIATRRKDRHAFDTFRVPNQLHILIGAGVGRLDGDMAVPVMTHCVSSATKILTFLGLEHTVVALAPLRHVL